MTNDEVQILPDVTNGPILIAHHEDLAVIRLELEKTATATWAPAPLNYTTCLFNVSADPNAPGYKLDDNQNYFRSEKLVALQSADPAHPITLAEFYKARDTAACLLIGPGKSPEYTAQNLDKLGLHLPELMRRRKARLDNQQRARLRSHAENIRTPATAPASEVVPSYIARSHLSLEPPPFQGKRAIIINSADYDRLMQVLDPAITRERRQKPDYDVHKFLLSGMPLIAIALRDPTYSLINAHASRAKAAGIPALLIGPDHWRGIIPDPSDGHTLLDLETELEALRTKYVEQTPISAAQLNPNILGPNPSARTTAIIAFTAAAGLTAALALGFAAAQATLQKPMPTTGLTQTTHQTSFEP